MLKGFHMAFIYYNNENQPSIHWQISDLRQDLDSIGHFEAPWSPYVKAIEHLRTRGFHMAFK